MMLLPKKVGPFTLMRRLGADGATVSYTAILDEPAGKQVVARQIEPWLRDDPRIRSELEARVNDLKAVRHPSLIDTIDYVVVDGEHFIISDWVDGVSLRQLLFWSVTHRQPLPHNIYLDIATRICNGLEALHSRPGTQSGAENVLHLGLSPECVILKPDGKLVLGVYGLVRSPTVSSQGKAAGVHRVEYLSPEQTHPDQTLTPATDIFSLGATLYELLTLTPLFKAGSRLQTMHRIRRAEVTTQLLEVKEQLPGLDKVLYRALSLNPRHRYQRAFVLREDLRGLMAGYSFSDIEATTRDFLAPLIQAKLVGDTDEVMPNLPPSSGPQESTDALLENSMHNLELPAGFFEPDPSSAFHGDDTLAALRPQPTTEEHPLIADDSDFENSNTGALLRRTNTGFETDEESSTDVRELQQPAGAGTPIPRRRTFQPPAAAPGAEAPAASADPDQVATQMPAVRLGEPDSIGPPPSNDLTEPIAIPQDAPRRGRVVMQKPDRDAEDFSDLDYQPGGSSTWVFAAVGVGAFVMITILCLGSASVLGFFGRTEPAGAEVQVAAVAPTPKVAPTPAPPEPEMVAAAAPSPAAAPVPLRPPSPRPEPEPEPAPAPPTPRPVPAPTRPAPAPAPVQAPAPPRPVPVAPAPRPRPEPVVVAAMPPPAPMPPAPLLPPPEPESAMVPDRFEDDAVALADLGAAEAEPLPAELPALSDLSEHAYAGHLSTDERRMLGEVPITDSEFTRSRVLLYQDAKSRRSIEERRTHLEAMMQLPENQYRPEYLVEQAQIALTDRDYDTALERAELAERHWARLPPELVFSRRAAIFEIEAAAHTGIFYASDGEDMVALERAMRVWEKYRRLVEMRKRGDLEQHADGQIAKLADMRARLQ